MKKTALVLGKRFSNAIFGPDLLNRSALARRCLAGWNLLWSAASPAQRRQRAFERLNPDAPWLAPSAIPAIERLLRPEHRVFEYGAGRSTLWFARQVAEVISVEGRPEWAAKVRDLAAAQGLAPKVRVIDVPLAADCGVPPQDESRYVRAIRPFPAFDVVLVDGHLREATLHEAFAHVRPGGLVILDNADQMGLEQAVARYAPFLLGSHTNAIWVTNLYRAPGPSGAPPN